MEIKVRFEDILNPRTFEQELSLCQLQASNLSDPPPRESAPEGWLEKYADWFNGMHRQELPKLLSAAEEESRLGNKEAAWNYLCRAARNIGYLTGMSNAYFTASSTYQIKREFAKNGRRGGAKKGEEPERLRVEIAKALVASSKRVRLKSRADFDLRYHEIAATFKGYSHTTYQLKRIVARPEVKALLLPLGRVKR